MPQRPQVQDLGTVPLQPAARPTDQFYRPDVHRSNSGSGLIQLAEALERIQPQMREIVDRRAQQYRQDQEAVGVSLTERYKNMADFQKAVDAGLIKESPWAIVKAKQILGKNAVRDSMQNAWNEYVQSPLRKEDSLDAVRSFFRDKVNPLMAGQDAYTLEGMAPEADQLIETYVNEHMRWRSQDRQIQIKTDFGNTVNDIIRSVPPETYALAMAGDAAALQSVHEVTNLINAEARNGELIMNEAEVKGIVKDTIFNYSRGIKSSSPAAVLTGMVSGKNGLSLREDSSIASELVHLPGEITRMKLEEERAKVESLELADKLEERQAFDAYRQATAKIPEGQEKPDYVSWLQNSEQGAKLSMTALERAATYSRFQNHQAATQASKGWLNAASLGKLDPNDINFQSWVAKATNAGMDNDVQTVLSINNMMQDKAKWGTTDRDTYLQLADSVIRGDAGIKEICDVAAQGKLDRATFNGLFSLAHGQANENLRSLTTQALHNIEVGVTTRFVKTKYGDVTDERRAEVAGDAELHEQIKIAQARFMNSLSQARLGGEGYTDMWTKIAEYEQKAIDAAPTILNQASGKSTIDQIVRQPPATQPASTQPSRKEITSWNLGNDVLERYAGPQTPLPPSVISTQEQPIVEGLISLEGSRPVIIGSRTRNDYGGPYQPALRKYRDSDAMTLFPDEYRTGRGDQRPLDPVDSIHTLRSKMWKVFNDEKFNTGGDVLTSKGNVTVKNVRTYYHQLDAQFCKEARDEARKHEGYLQSDMADGRWAQFFSGLANGNTLNATTESERMITHQIVWNMSKRNWLRDVAGYEPEEAAKEFGPDAWKKVRIYGNAWELQQNWDEVKRVFKIDPKRQDEFLQTQAEMRKRSDAKLEPKWTDRYGL